MTITYRDATAVDWTAIDHLFRTGFCDTFAHLYDPQDLQSFLCKFTRGAWIGELVDPRFAFRIAEDAGEPVGYLKLGPHELPVEPSAVPIELRQLYVLKAWHGSGVSRELMRWALATARERGAGEMFLTVYTDNHRARRFYEGYGFEYLGPYKFMVGKHADEDIIMRLAL